MAVAFALGVATGSPSNASSYASGSFTPAAGDWLIAFVEATGTLQDPVTMTDSQGIGFDMFKAYANITNVVALYCFIARKLAANSAMTVTFDCTGDAATGATIVVIRVTGQEGVPGYIRQVAQASGVGNTLTPAVPLNFAGNTNNGFLGACMNDGLNPANMTPPASWTETGGADTGHNTPTCGLEVCNRASGETGSTITWGSNTTASSFDWNAIVLEIYAAGQGPTMLDGCGGVVATP